MPDFKAIMREIRFSAGALPQTAAGGAYSAPSDSLAVFKGPTCNRRAGKMGKGRWGRRRRREREWGRKEERGSERKDQPPPQKKNILAYSRPCVS